MTGPSVVVVMPVYNEAGCLEAVVRDWLAVLPADGRLLVVDDGSRDATPAILGRIQHPRLDVRRQANAGHGAAILTGYREAIDRGAAWVFQTDSDGEVAASDFQAFWDLRGTSSFLLGQRIGRQDSQARILLSGVHRTLLRWMFAVSLPDPNVPFRLMKAPLLTELLTLLPEAPFAPNVMLSILAVRRGENIIHVPVSHRPRAAGVPSFRGLRTIRIGLDWTRQLMQFRRRLVKE